MLNLEPAQERVKYAGLSLVLDQYFTKLKHFYTRAFQRSHTIKDTVVETNAAPAHTENVVRQHCTPWQTFSPGAV